VIHPASAAADQGQSREVVIDSAPLPPVAGSSGVLLVTLMSHLVPDGCTTLVVDEPHDADADAATTSAPIARTHRTMSRPMQFSRRQEFSPESMSVPRRGVTFAPPG
jgi:hypothetical protein